MSDDIPEPTGDAQAAETASITASSARLRWYAKGLVYASGPKTAADMHRAGKVIMIAVETLEGISHRGDCACPYTCRTALKAMAEALR